MEIQIVTIIILLVFIICSLVMHFKQLDKLESLSTENEELKKQISEHKRKESIELQEFLADLFQGEGLVRVERVDPSSVFLHNPKGLH